MMGKLSGRVALIGLITGLAALTTVILLTPIVRERFFTEPKERGRKAYARSDWSEALGAADAWLEREPGQAEAFQLKARALARLGRAREALAIESRLAPEQLEAEDLFLVGQSLIQQNRTALGWISLEAATRIAPDDQEISKTLAGLHRRVNTLGPVVTQVDRLSAIPSGAALAELVSGLLAIDPEHPSSDDPEPIFDRLLRLDRKRLHGLTSRLAVRKLLARELLEQGRAARMRALLAPIATQDDPEISWLFSRAYLVEGALPDAIEALERAGAFGGETPLAPEPARYSGAKSCEACHGAIYRSQQGSRHARTILMGENLASTPLPKGVLTDPEDSRITHQFQREGNRITVSSRVGDETVRAVIEYALGSGRHGITMVAREPSGTHRSLRISYYPAGDYWGLTGGFNPHPTDAMAFLGERLSDASFRDCVNCHTTRFISEQRRDSPEAADRGIGCERCHGPADHHLRSVEIRFPDPAIAQPRAASPSDRMMLCAQCHRADGEIPPSDPRFIRFQSTTLAYSRCLTESDGLLDCTACHNPHRDVETDPRYYEARCLVCHGGKDRPPIETTGRLPEALPSRTCPVDATKNCLSCHMPKVKNVAPYSVFTDHHIRIHRSSETTPEATSAR